jgi:hypothetical protein
MSVSVQEAQVLWVKEKLGVTPTGSGTPTPGGTPAPPGSDPLAIKAATDLEALALRIGKEIQTEIPRATKPIALKERIAFCTSELEQLDKGIATLDAAKLDRPARKTTLASTSEALRKGLVGAKAAGIRSANETLTAVIRSLNDQTAKFTEQLRSTRTDPKTLYKPISALLDTVTHEHTDWAAQVKEGVAYLGKDATALEIGVGKLGEIETELNEMIGRCLPKLTSAPGKKPEGVGGPGGGEVVGDAETVLIELKDWSAAKQKYGSNPKEMQKLADKRKELVDKYLNDTLNPWGLTAGPDKGWVSVGSSDPTSDYDISVNKHGKKTNGEKTDTLYDYQIVKMFNDHFRAKYGVESGTIFDTNLYASAKAEVPELGEDATPAEQDAIADVNASADVGALMKMRRYMSSADFEDYRVRTLAAVSGTAPKAKAQAKALDKQFRLADANYMISLLDIVEKMEKLLQQPVDEAKLTDELKHEREESEHLIAEWKKGSGAEGLAIATGEEALEQLARHLEHMKDLNTMATNDLYTEATGKARDQEGTVNTFKDNLTQIKGLISTALTSKDVDFAKLAEQLAGLGVQDNAVALIKKGDVAGAGKLVDGQLAGMLSDLARQQALTMFYANEAYQSGGPFKHVVWAGQAVETDVKAEVNKTDPGAWDLLPAPEQKKLVDKKRAERRAELTEDESLQSFNEQLGDFLKDLAHYGDKDPGKAIIQSSKYLERLVDAIGLMNDKHMFDADGPLKTKLLDELSRQSKLSGELIAARKGNLWMVAPEGGAPVDQDEQRRAYACDFMKKLGITSVAGLGKTYVDLGIRVNAAARKAIVA